MIFWPIFGLFVIAAGYVIRNNFDFPDNKNLDGMVNMVGWGVKVAGLLLFIISTFNGMFFMLNPALNIMSAQFWAKKKWSRIQGTTCTCLGAIMRGKMQCRCRP